MTEDAISRASSAFEYIEPGPEDAQNPDGGGITVRSDDYWFEDGSLVVQVELTSNSILPSQHFQVNNTLYNVHASLLKRQSEHFKSLKGSAVVGEPYIVPNMDTESFESVLSMIYPL